MKRCTRCKAIKDDNEFGTRNNSSDGLTGQCKSCLNCKHQKYRDGNREMVREHARQWVGRNSQHVAENTSKWRKKNPIATALQQSRYVARRHGYKTPCTASVEEIQKCPSGTCAICGVSETQLRMRLQLDHDHATGDFRGWLCGKCNKLLGLAGDNKDVLKNAIAYLEQTSRRESKYGFASVQ